MQSPFTQIRQKFEQYDVVLGPDKDAAEWWAGAPSVVRDRNGMFWLACRMRTADSPLGRRGYEIRLLRSEDGVHFDKVHSITREEVAIPGFERPSLLIDPHTKRFKLYGCGPWQGGPWTIFKFDDAENPAAFKASSARPVIQPYPRKEQREVRVDGYKDPFILYAEDSFHAYVIGQLGAHERVFHFVSGDGEKWEPGGSPNESIMQLDGWHDFFVRPACVVSLGIGYLFVYEGSNLTWYDPVYNIATGLAFTFDLHHMIDLTPDSPLVASTTPSDQYHTWRYSHWMRVGEEMWIYAEVAKPNRTNEIRLFRLKP